MASTLRKRLESRLPRRAPAVWMRFWFSSLSGRRRALQVSTCARAISEFDNLSILTDLGIGEWLARLLRLRLWAGLLRSLLKHRR